MNAQKDSISMANIKGAADSAPAQQIMRNRITDVLRRNFESYGYLPLETAQLNYLELLIYKYEDNAEIVREIYKLKDQGDRDLGLRFDLTVPFCKFIAANQNIRMPFKRYEIGKVWRNGPIKAGRMREFYQCDVDAVGIAGAHIEAELMALAVKTYKELGIEPVIKYGSRKLLTVMITHVNVAASKTEAVIALIDKYEKMPRDEFFAELAKFMDEQNAKWLLESFDKPESLLLGGEGIEELGQLQKILKQLDIDKYCVFAPYLARGLNYYTGTIWEVFDKNRRITSSLGGGGRYDKIITGFIDNGRQYPAVGMSFGLEPICAVLSDGSDENKMPPVDLLIVPMQTESFCQKYAEKLRSGGRKVLVWLGGGKVGKALEYANAEKIPYAAVIGENEIASGSVSIKDMQTGKIEVIKIEV